MNRVKKSIFLGLIMLLVGTFVTCASASSELSNSGGGTWKYQREISIKENSGTVLTDYQVLIELNGADFLSEAKSDGADVRFTDYNGNELNYWIESWDYAGKNAKIWVKVLSMSAGSITIIRMYYGNPNAGSSNNGDATFEFFDDFNDNYFDSNKWIKIELAGGTVTEINNELKISQIQNSGCCWKGPYVKSIKQLPDTLIFEANYRFESYSGSGYLVSGAILGLISENQADFGPKDPVFDHIPSEGYSLRFQADPVWAGIIKLRHECTASGHKHGSSSFGNIEDAATPASLHKFKLVYSGSNIFAYFDNVLKDTTTIIIDDNKYIQLDAVARYNGDTVNTIFDNVRVRKYTSSEPTITFAPIKSSSLTITKSASPYSLRQFQETTIKVSIENSGTSEIRAIEIMNSIHPAFDLTNGDFPNPKKFDSIRAGESRELQYTIKSKESGAFTLDPATVTYADSEGNIQEVKSEAVSIKVVPSLEGSPEISPPSDIGTSSAVLLHGEKSDVVLGEDILLKLSAVNLITKPPMSVQVMIYPPSGMSVTGSEFVKSGAGIYTTTYTLNPGDGKDIEVHIKSNQVGDFNIKGRIVYYFGEDKDKAEDHTLNLPIKVRKEAVPQQGQMQVQNSNPSTEGFETIIGIISILLVSFVRKW